MGKLHHIVEAQQFDRKFLEEELFPLTREMEEVAKKGGTPCLSGKRMILFFMNQVPEPEPLLRWP